MTRTGAICCVLALGACAASPAPRTAEQRPTIVSLNPCTDAILAEVTVPGQLLAISPFSHDPAESSMDPALAARLPAVGTVEQVAALHPDLVVSGTYDPPASVEAYRRLGIAYEGVPIAPSVAASVAQVRRLAALAGHPDKGEALVKRIEASLAAASPPGPSRPSAIVWEGGGLVAGSDTLVVQLFARTGFADGVAARGLRQGQVLPLERILADPPRAILVAGAEGDRALSHPALTALKETQRFRLDPALLYCGGPTIPRLAARLAQIRRELPR